MICLIKQPAGLGDIFFCQKIGKIYSDKGFTVVWPVYDRFLYLNDYIENTVKFVSNNTKIQSDKILNLEQASNLVGGKIMWSKYSLAEVEGSNWFEYFNFKRNLKKENELFYDILKLKDNEDYNFVNNLFASLPDIRVYKGIKEENNFKSIQMNIFPGFTIFDWCKVLENAFGIYMVDSGMNYIIEKLNLKAQQLFLYPRWGNETIYQLEGIFKTKWEYKIIDQNG